MAAASRVHLDEHFAGVDEAWLWIVPHPADPAGRRGRTVQTRIGTGSADAFRPVLELRSKPARLLGGFANELLDLTGPEPREAGRFAMRFTHQDPVIHGAFCEVDGVESSFALDGRFTVGDAEDHCSIATRGKPVAGPAPARALFKPAERRRRREAEAAAHQMDDVVVGELTAFDGWLTASQELTPVGEAVAEAWRVRIDTGRPAPGPGPVSLALVQAGAALCHRRAMPGSGGGLADLVLGH